MPIQESIDNQARCRDWLALNGHDHYDTQLARLGASDWLMEEVINRAEEYEEFLSKKRKRHQSAGFSCPTLNPHLFTWQAEIVRWALKKGKAALFEGCGLGKTIQELEWAYQVSNSINNAHVLLVAPLSIAEQTHFEEAPKFGYKTTICRSQSDCKPGINITNYEMLNHFDPRLFSGVVLDESSILKSFTGKLRNQIIDMFECVPYKLAASATPSPNDYMELGNHAEFLNCMSRSEMLSMFFVHDGEDTSAWRLKGHAQVEFWKWVCSWAVVIRTPSDIQHSDSEYILPEIHRHQVTIGGEVKQASTMQERRNARRDSISERCKAAADIVNSHDGQWIVWTGLNDESTLATSMIPDATEITGSHSREFKMKSIEDFKSGKIRVIVTKGSIFGWGQNLQCCHQWIHLGLSDSFEAMYQIDRRCWRFGQSQQCDCYVITSSAEGAVVRNIERKEADFDRMNASIVSYMREEMNKEIHGAIMTEDKFETEWKNSESWTVILGDSSDELKKISTGSVHYSIFSPPFASLYTYSASDRDLGNCSNYEEFITHFRFIATELYRVIMVGRLVSFHCMLLPTSIMRDGFIGLKDFRGDLIRLFESVGFLFHSEVVIWKNPLVAAVRTHALGLAHKQIVKDAAMCRQGIPDYLITMRKPGINPEPVSHGPRGFERYIGEDNPPDREKSDDPKTNKYSHEVWQRYASPVWMDINPSDTLQKESAREDADERHICPLQLQVIRRALELWTNQGDVVLSPFAGIGSEGYVALEEGRCFIGIELKRSYYEQCWRNMQQVETRLEAEAALRLS